MLNEFDNIPWQVAIIEIVICIAGFTYLVSKLVPTVPERDIRFLSADYIWNHITHHQEEDSKETAEKLGIPHNRIDELIIAWAVGDREKFDWIVQDIKSGLV